MFTEAPIRSAAGRHHRINPKPQGRVTKVRVHISMLMTVLIMTCSIVPAAHANTAPPGGGGSVCDAQASVGVANGIIAMNLHAVSCGSPLYYVRLEPGLSSDTDSKYQSHPRAVDCHYSQIGLEQCAERGEGTSLRKPAAPQRWEYGGYVYFYNYVGVIAYKVYVKDYITI